MFYYIQKGGVIKCICVMRYTRLREISNTVIAKEELNDLAKNEGVLITPMGESSIFPNCKWYDVVYCGCWFNIYVEEELS